jgi:hypothetical protein
MNIWLNGEYIFIKVNNHFVYNFNISRIKEFGTVNDAPNILSVYGRINHLREKNWWNARLEQSLLELFEKILK